MKIQNFVKFSQAFHRISKIASAGRDLSRGLAEGKKPAVKIQGQSEPFSTELQVYEVYDLLEGEMKDLKKMLG